MEAAPKRPPLGAVFFEKREEGAFFRFFLAFVQERICDSYLTPSVHALRWLPAPALDTVVVHSLARHRAGFFVCLVQKSARTLEFCSCAWRIMELLDQTSSSSEMPFCI